MIFMIFMYKQCVLSCGLAMRDGCGLVCICYVVVAATCMSSSSCTCLGWVERRDIVSCASCRGRWEQVGSQQARRHSRLE